ncbi:hypothetical protein D3874_09665 [Oleomonas cavernae]|uniref:Uncharacterized protein n=1 Tax=Oleomonas cavernae TaxID=2320859 RepID=A0A418WB85_9PROT|nr:hypothetical protein D3874_09665 [Oleomonas cavernae]
MSFATPVFAGNTGPFDTLGHAELLGLDVTNDKVAVGAAHLMCREATIAATEPDMPWSLSRQVAQVQYEGLAQHLEATAARADALLIEGLREAGMADASAQTVAAMAVRVRRGLESRVFQVNPATAGDMALACKSLAATAFDSIPSTIAAR